MDITILITDTHFGVKQNSMTWLKSQMSFFKNQLIPYMEREEHEGNNIRLIHLGDVFDSRSTISTYVATQVVNMFKELTIYADEIIIVAGNHDYYSPNSNEVDTLSLLLGSIPEIKLITKECFVSGEDLFVPWYQWEMQDGLQQVVEKLHIKNIFTHADIVTSKFSVRGCNIYSGHVHIPYIKGFIRNLGSCFALNFADSNSLRGFYVIRDGQLQMVENTESIKFYRFYNEDILNDLSYLKLNDYIELYVNQSNLSKESFNTKINNMMKEYKNIWIIPQANVLDSSDDIKFEGYDVASIAKELIPEDLQDKFNTVVNNVN